MVRNRDEVRNEIEEVVLRGIGVLDQHRLGVVSKGWGEFEGEDLERGGRLFHDSLQSQIMAEEGIELAN